MSNVFNFVGHLRPVRDTESFKGFSKIDFKSGWMTERLRFNIIAGDNRHLVEINAGRWSQEDKNVIYTFEQVDGNNRGNHIRVPWNQRNNPEIIDKIVGWRIFTCDLDTYNHRQELKESGDTEALKASENKRKHFIAGTDFCEYVNKVVNSEKTKDWKFRVKGNINYTYSEKTGRYYSTYEVTKIYRVDDDKEPSSEVDMDFYFTEGAIDSGDFEEAGKAIVNGYTQFYDNTTKKNWFCPIGLVVRDKVKGWEHTFNKFDGDEVRKIGLVCQKIDGAQRVDIKVEDLSEEVKENIEYGLITEEEAIRDAGGQMYGERIQEIRIVGLGRGYTKGSETTMYTVDDLERKPMMEPVEDLFANNDDDDL